MALCEGGSKQIMCPFFAQKRVYIYIYIRTLPRDGLIGKENGICVCIRRGLNGVFGIKHGKRTPGKLGGGGESNK